MNKYVSPRTRQLREERIKGLALIAVSLAGFAALFGFAFWHDSRIDIAKPAAFIGRCDGRLMAGLHRSSFPKSCAWIDPIHVIEESGK